MDLVTPGLGLLFWQTITFFIVLFLLAKFAWKPIISSLHEREDSIEQALGAAQRAKDEILELQNVNEKLIQEARIERDRIIKEAHATSVALINEAKGKASEESARLLENARLAIHTEKQFALTEVKNQAANLSVQIAEKLLRKELSSDEAQKNLVSEYIKEANLN